MKIKWGALVVDGRNKIGGQVASKNKSGSYMKNKVTPTNPNTTAQANARANLTIVSRAWSALTAAQREAWNAYAAQYLYIDIFGDSKYLTGFNYYLKCNLNLLNAGSAVVTDPPASQAVADLVFEIDPATAPDDISIVSATLAMPANTKVIVLGSACLSPGRTISKSDLRQIGVFSSMNAGTLDLTNYYVGKFGDLVATQRVGIATFCINTGTGLTSQLRLNSAIVDAG